MGTRPNDRRFRRGARHLRWRTAITILVLASAGIVSAQTSPQQPSTVQVRIQMSWWGGAPNDAASAIVTLDPITHQTPPRTVRVSSGSVAVLQLAPGRYQLITTEPVVSGRQAWGWNIELALFDAVNDIRLSPENAVRLEAGDRIEPKNSSPLLASASATPSHTAPPPAAKQQIVALLKDWAASLQAHDLKAHMACYAPELARYLQQRNVSSREIQAQKRKQLQLYTQSIHVQLSDIDLSIDGGQAMGTALENWRFASPEVQSRGRVLVSFEFAQIDSRWLITSEWQQAVPGN
jgi:ketosteroid isomerase-like protein